MVKTNKKDSVGLLIQLMEQGVELPTLFLYSDMGWCTDKEIINALIQKLLYDGEIRDRRRRITLLLVGLWFLTILFIIIG